MTYGTSTLTSAIPARDLMLALQTPIQAAGLTLVDGWGAPTTGNYMAAFGNGVFCAVGSGTATAMTSPDGITWTQRYLPALNNWSQIVYGGGLFVALAAGSTSYATSPDGITWTPRNTLPVAGTYRIMYGGGLFVVLLQGSTNVYTSPDGVTWTTRTGVLPVTANWTGMAYGGGMFVAVSQSLAGVSSPDGVTWTSRPMPGGGGSNYIAVAYGGSQFVAVNNTGGGTATSPDGMNWTYRAGLISNNYQGVGYGNGLYFIAAAGTVNGYTSTDGITWTGPKTMPASGTWQSFVYGNSTYAVLPNSLSVSASSPDASTWTGRTLTGNSSSAFSDVYKSPGASNAFGSDWYLILHRNTDAATTVYYQVAEGYDPVAHKMSNFGGTAAVCIPTATTYTNPAVAIDPNNGYASLAYVTIAATAFSYWYSVTKDRFILGVKATAENAFYCGLYDDLLPAGVTQFPLVAVQLPTTQANSNTMGFGSTATTGGFTREPGGTASSGANFEARVSNGLLMTGSAVCYPANNAYTPLTTSAALYGNTGGLGRCLVGSGRPVTQAADAVRGLLKDVYVSTVSSIAGDTITASGKTYVRFGGLSTVYGYFVDSSV